MGDPGARVRVDPLAELQLELTVLRAGTDEPPRLLLIDDDESVLRPVGSYFRSLGYEVLTARERQEGEASLARERIGLVILDVALTPFGREGLDLLGHIRRAHPRLPVVIMSGHVSKDVEDEARRLGADRVLTKPQSLADLAALVASILDGRRRGRGRSRGPARDPRP